MRYEAVVFGASAGGLEALKVILPMLPGDFALPIIVVQHRDEHKAAAEFQGMVAADQADMIEELDDFGQLDGRHAPGLA